MITSSLRTIAAASVLAISAFAANAATIDINSAADGSSFTINNGDEFDGDVGSNAGGAGSYTLTFTAGSTPLDSITAVSLNYFDKTNFTGVVVSWLDTLDAVLASASVNGSPVELTTQFTAANPTQKLRFTWTDSVAEKTFDYDLIATTSEVPLPASVLLLGGAMLGLGALRRNAA